MRLGIPDYPDAFHFFNKIVTFFFKKKVFHNSLSKSMGTRFLFSKVGSVYFPVIWYETLITRSIPKVLGIIAGFQSIVFGRYYSFLIMFLFIFFVAYLSVLITNIFETDKRLYCKLNDFILQNEVRLHNFSYWEKFKKLYLYVDYPTTKKFHQKTTKGREYSITSLKLGPILTIIKAIAEKKLLATGSELTPFVVPKIASAAANSAVTIGSQGLTAVGIGAVLGIGVGGGLVLIGGDQVIRYCGENVVNSVTQPNHQWPLFKMKTPAEVWFHGSKR